MKTVKIIASLALAFASALTLSACVAHSSSGSAASPSVSKTPKPFPSVTVRSMEEQTTQVSSDGSWSYVSNDGLQVKVNADGSWTKGGWRLHDCEERRAARNRETYGSSDA